MYFLRCPSDNVLRALLGRASQRHATFPHLYATETPHLDLPEFRKDHHRTRIGTGRAAFRAARGALRAWRQFDLDWLRLVPAGPVPNAGLPAALLVRLPGVWSLNVSKVIYVTESHGAIERYGYAWSTLDCHVLCGEESFIVEWHRGDDAVWLDMLAFSQPSGWLPRIGYPLLRHRQKRFAREAPRQVKGAVRAAE